MPCGSLSQALGDYHGQCLWMSLPWNAAVTSVMNTFVGESVGLSTKCKVGATDMSRCPFSGHPSAAQGKPKVGPDRVPRASVSCGWKGGGRRGGQHAGQGDKRHGQVTPVAKR